MTQVTEADRNLAGWFTRRMADGIAYEDTAAKLIADHRIQARKEALEELRSAIFTYAERATEAAQSSLQIAYSIANEVE